jgi:hypothetical protein
MYKCPKCEYKSEEAGTCPTDNETLVLETPEESIPSEGTAPETTPENVSPEEPKSEE